MSIRYAMRPFVSRRRIPAALESPFSRRPFLRTVLHASIPFLLAGAFALPSRAAGSRPNVILIMTDNHGAWTLGCYGNREIRTPHIDRLAREGAMFTRAFACNPVCSPTRASYLTGLMPSQHGVHCFLFGGRLQIGPDARSTLDAFRSLPEILRDEGYACGLVGKWHLGGNIAPQEGLDDYWVTMPHGATATFYGARIIEDGKIRTEPSYLTEFWTRHADRFIRRQAQTRQPFFLLLAYNGPYALGRLLLREGENRHVEYYRSQPLHSFPRESAHAWLYNNQDYLDNPTAIRRVAAEVSGIDDGVGTILDTLEELHLDHNTLILFVADQGWVGGQGGFFGMGDHTRPATARDGMMRVPMIWWQPGTIPAGKRFTPLVSIVDVLPSILGHLGLSDKMPSRPRSPGRDFSSLFSGDDLPEWKNEIFYEFESLRCIRTDRWKYVHRFPHGPHELYDLKEDPAEFTNLADDPNFTETRFALKERLDRFFRRYADPKYDLWTGGSSQTRLLVWDDAAKRAAKSAAASLSGSPKARSAGSRPDLSLTVPEGFQVVRAAGPPLVRHPTMATFDDRGRLFVCESAGRNLSASELEKELPNSIRLLEDTDGDGKFDKATTFADKMTFPMGAAWHDGALYVASPPYIWRLEDTDGDGVADRRTILVREFGYTGNAASIHGCFAGPDGRLYWCDGYHGHEFRDSTGKVVAKREGSYLFSCRADGSDVRIHAGGGMDNPVEVDFMPSGEMLGTVNILYTRPRVDCLVHWLYGGTYPHRARVLAERNVTGELLGPVHRFGHVAVSGMLRYRSGLLDHRWREHLFVTYFNSGKLVRVALERSGSTFQATEREFVSSSSGDFHPTDVVEDADGTLLLIDTGGWFYRGCPTSQLAKPDVLGGIYRIRRRGMPRQTDPWGRSIQWSKLTPAACVGLLGDTRHAVRRRAIAECSTRGPAILPQLRAAALHRDRLWRLGAVWSLAQMATRAAVGDDRNGKPSPSYAATLERILPVLQQATTDRDLDVRLAACHTLAIHPHPSSRPVLERCLVSNEPAVRRVAARGLGRIGRAAAVPALLQSLESHADRAEEHAIIYALIEIGAVNETAAGLTASSPRVRRGALIALDQMDAPAGRDAIARDAFLGALASDDSALRRAAIGILHRRPDRIADTRGLLQRWLSDPAELAARGSAVSSVLRAALPAPPVAALVGKLLADEQLDTRRRRFLLDAIAQQQVVSPHPSWIEPLRRELAAPDPARCEAAVKAAAALRPSPFRNELVAIVEDERLPASLRLSAAESATAASGTMPDAVFTLLIEQLDSAAPTSVRRRAVQVLARAALNKPQLIQLADHLAQAGPVALPELIRPFQRSADPDVARVMLARLADARSFSSIPPEQFAATIQRYPRELLPRANALLARLRQTDQERRARIGKLLDDLPRADPDRGKKIFFSERAKCSSCHRIGERGERIGPELTKIGANRRPADLLESILFPSATIVRQYEPFLVALDDGRMLSGLITHETADNLTLQPATGDPVVIPRESVEEIQPSTTSIMPAGLDKELAEQDLLDLVAFLLGCR